MRAGNIIREAWMLRFGLPVANKKIRSWLSDEVLWQLCRCRSDEARRLILGVSR